MHTSCLANRVIASALFTTLISTSLHAADPSLNWPHWRGPSDIGSTEAGAYPVKFDATTNVMWKVNLPGKGCSTPIVFDQKIYVTAPVDGQDALLAYDWAGKPLWQTIVAPTAREKATTAPAAIHHRPPTASTCSSISKAAPWPALILTESCAGRPICRNALATTPSTGISAPRRC